jgi:hypothetical protein
LPSRSFRVGGGLLILWWVVAPGPAVAWGPKGHLAATALTESRLCPAARREVERLVGPQTLAEASLWPDTIRDDPAWRHTKDWHYADVRDDEPAEALWAGDRGRLLIVLDEQLSMLADASAADEARATALRFVAHLLLDLHQPLHVGRHEDRGGNDIRVRLGDRETNLHRVWDSGLLARTGLKAKHLSASMAALVEAGISAGAGSLEAWAEESRALRPWVYDFDARPRIPSLSRRYEVTATQLALTRLTQAAVRLESVLEDLWCPGAAGNPAVID